MGLRNTVEPKEGPVTMAEAQAHLRVEDDAEAVLIAAMLASAVRACEQKCGRAIMQQTWELTLDGFPCDWIDLAMPPLQAVSSVKYFDSSNVLQTLASTEYSVDSDSEPARIYRAFGKSWPSTAAVPNAVRVQFVAGYANAGAVPAPIKSWILLTIGALYENREAFVAGATVNALPFVDRLLDRYTIPRL
jgi:uncharacterized phiE125 gp8 family phage protein